MRTPYDAALRWRERQLDALRREVAALETARARLTETLTLLETELVEELAVPDPMGGINFAAYVQRQRQRQQQTQQQQDSLDSQLRQIQVQVSAAFAEVKTLDIAATRFREQELAARAKAEQAELDDIAGQRSSRAAQESNGF